MPRDATAAFLALVQASTKKPVLYGQIRFPTRTIKITDRRGATILTDYEPIVQDWGTLAAALTGFGNAFATQSTTVRVSNLPMRSTGKRFGDYFPDFPSRVEADLYWAMQDLDTPSTIQSLLAIKGIFRNHKKGFAGAQFDVISRAEKLMMRDVLVTTDRETWPDCPEVNVGRGIPLVVTQASKVPEFTYKADRSRVLVCEDLGVITLFTDLGSRYWQGVSVVETETALGINPPIE